MTVVAGEMVETVFEVTCVATLGGITVSTSTTGPGTDNDGYTARVDDGPEQPIGQNGSVALTGIVAGTHSVTLGDVATNCAVEGDNPRSVDVPVGDPVPVAFRVSCTSGVRQWTTMTSGTDADLPDVWGTSASDMFVVGELPVDRNGNVASVILHFDGATWAPQFTEIDLMLRGVWGSAANDVYAVGFDFAGDARMVRFDGTQWSEVPGFGAGAREEIALFSLWGSSASDIFAARNLGQVGRYRVAALVAPHRRPRRVVADGRQPGFELRHAAVAIQVEGARAARGVGVEAGNSPDLAAVVGAVVGPAEVLLHAVHADAAVEQQRRGSGSTSGRR